MSEQNVNLVRAHLEAVGAGGFDVAADFMHPDFEMYLTPTHPEPGPYRSWSAAAESMQGWAGSFERFGWQAEEFIDAGDRVIVVVLEQVTARGGVVLEQRYGVVYTVRDGKIARIDWFDGKQQALDAARMSEEAKPRS